jgi:sugar phosphate isomerase/epimerase
MSMRGTLKLCAGVIALMAMAAEAHAACTPIAQEKIGLQLYNMLGAMIPKAQLPAAVAGGPVTISQATLDATFARLHTIGFRNLEGLGDRLPAPLPAYHELLIKNDLAQIGSHRPLDSARWNAILDEALALGQKNIGAPGFGEPGIASLKDTLATAVNLNRFGAAAAAKGLTLYVHNHDEEIKTKYPYDLAHDGHPHMVSAWEIVAANTDPRFVHFEVDVHWTRVGFGLDHFADVLVFLRAHRDRIAFLHVKDTTPDGRITDLGRGTTDWPAVFAAAGPQIRYYIWEYDDDPDPFRSAEIAYHYLRCEK